MMSKVLGAVGTLILGVVITLFFTGCGSSGTNQVQVQPQASDQTALRPMAVDGVTPAMTKVKGVPVHNLDLIEKVNIPYSLSTTIISLASDVEVRGWAIDEAAQKAAGGVELLIDGKAYKTQYGLDRPDVRTFFKNPAYNKSGFTFMLLANSLSRGPHNMIVRVISADAKTYYEGNPLSLVVK
jgi:hypothetical protein